MVDIHCHILPGIDDGSESWEMTPRCAAWRRCDGITHIVATPHCDGHYEYDRAHFTDMLATLSEVAEGRLTFSIGCDFHLSPHNVEAAMDDPRPFAIGDTQYLMVEFDHHGIPSNAERATAGAAQPRHGADHYPSGTKCLPDEEPGNRAGVHRDGLPGRR